MASWFSTRTAWERSSSEPRPEVDRTEGAAVVDLTTSNPTACEFEYDAARILAPLSTEAAMLYDPEPFGVLPARKAVCRYYAEHGACVEPQQIVLTASTSEAYSHLFRLLCEPGDEVLIARPSYPLFDTLADLSDVTLRSYPLFFDHGWWIDIAELERAITHRTKAIIVVDPNNPTGHTTSTTERTWLREICQRYQLSLVVDEVFLDYSLHAGARVHSFAASTSNTMLFILSGLSKIAALPQMKVGWIVVAGPEEERKEALARLEIMADTFLSVNTPAQMALPAWLAYAPEVQGQILKRIRNNVQRLRDAELYVTDFEGGWSAILTLRRTFSEVSAADALLGVGVLAHPAAFYGLEDPGRVVISLIVPEERMAEGIARIQALNLSRSEAL